MADVVRTEVLPEEAARLAEKLRAHLPELRERYAIDTLVLFGSYVRGDQRPDSDVDLLVTFTRTPTLFDLIEAEQEMEGILGVRVDLVMRSGLSPRFLCYVLREALPLLAENERTPFMSATSSRPASRRDIPVLRSSPNFIGRRAAARLLCAQLAMLACVVGPLPPSGDTWGA